MRSTADTVRRAQRPRDPPPSTRFPPFHPHRANHDASDDIEGDNEGDYTFDR